jgi:predicted ATPase
VTVSYYHGLLAAAHLGAGQISEATAALADGFAVAERFNERFVEAELHRIRAELLLAHADSDPAETETCLRRALEVAAAQQAKSLELRAAMTLYRWRRTSATREALAGTFACFREGSETADLKDARKLLDERS